MNKVLLLLLVFFFYACGSTPGEKISPSEIPNVVERTPSAQSDFDSILKSINISTINQYIHPDKGLWLIQSSGALPSMANTNQVDKNFPIDFSNCLNIELPNINCDSPSLWSKEGCFFQKINHFSESKIWVHCGLSKKQEEEIAADANSIIYTVINTSQHARYYFSLINGKWHLAFVDLRQPCTA